MSTTHGTREADADTPATTTTRPLYVGTGYDVGFGVDEPWSAAVDVQNTAVPDFAPERRWTSVLLGALGIVVLAVLVIAVITVAHHSSEPAERAPAPMPPSTSAVVPSPAAPTESAPPPAYSSVTATASTVVAPPPPVMQPGEPPQRPGVRQRLHDLFPRLFPGR